MTSTETRTVRAAKKLLAAIPDVTPDHGLSPEMVETIATRLRDAYGKDDHWLAWCNDAHVILNIVAPEFRRIETLEKALSRLLNYAERNTCQHDETHRGGVLWEICDQCGAKWADDRGGKPKFKWHSDVTNARAALSHLLTMR